MASVIGTCRQCGQHKYIWDGLCHRCQTAEQTLNRLAEVENLRKHPDLEEFDEYSEQWY
jgi:hypothetical protein